MCLHKPSFEEEEEGIEGNQSWFGRTRGLAILLGIPSVLFFSVLAILLGIPFFSQERYFFKGVFILFLLLFTTFLSFSKTQTRLG